MLSLRPARRGARGSACDPHDPDRRDRQRPRRHRANCQPGKTRRKHHRVSLLVPELDAKKLEVLKEIVPVGRRFGVLSDPATSVSSGLQKIADTARALGVELQTTEVRSPDELPAAFASLRAEGAQGVNVLSSPLFNSFRKQLGELLLSERLPGICEWREMAVSGCLASYGTTLRELFAVVASLTDKY
jgi:putative ABC transport system substrate-binding protein